MNISLTVFMDYVQCPLRARYKLWTGKEEVLSDPNDAATECAALAIGAYMKEVAQNNGDRQRALAKAFDVYRYYLLKCDQAGVFDSVFFASTYNHGLALIGEFDRFIKPDHDRPVFGAFPMMSYVNKTDSITGFLGGLIAFSDKNKQERHYGVVVIAEDSPVSLLKGHLLEGFAYNVGRQAMGELKDFPLCIVRVDPRKHKVYKYNVTREDLIAFESLSKAVIHGIKNNVFMPQPSKEVCRSCPYEKACHPRYAQPDINDYWKKEFLTAYEGSNH